MDSSRNSTTRWTRRRHLNLPRTLLIDHLRGFFKDILVEPEFTKTLRLSPRLTVQASGCPPGIRSSGITFKGT
jgi:hypothetical protein